MLKPIKADNNINEKSDFGGGLNTNAAHIYRHDEESKHFPLSTLIIIVYIIK